MMSVERTLIAGPWVGEFGWELFAWQAYVRALSRHFEETIIICRANSTALYRDFATRTIVYNPPPGTADSFFMHGLDFMSALKQVVKKNDIILSEGATLVSPPQDWLATQNALFRTNAFWKIQDKARIH